MFSISATSSMSVSLSTH